MLLAILRMRACVQRRSERNKSHRKHNEKKKRRNETILDYINIKFIIKLCDIKSFPCMCVYSNGIERTNFWGTPSQNEHIFRIGIDISRSKCPKVAMQYRRLHVRLNNFLKSENMKQTALANNLQHCKIVQRARVCMCVWCGVMVFFAHIRANWLKFWELVIPVKCWKMNNLMDFSIQFVHLQFVSAHMIG